MVYFVIITDITFTNTMKCIIPKMKHTVGVRTRAKSAHHPNS